MKAQFVSLQRRAQFLRREIAKIIVRIQHALTDFFGRQDFDDFARLRQHRAPFLSQFQRIGRRAVENRVALIYHGAHR